MANVNSIDMILENLIQNNIAKIKSTTPVNPSITKEDEWRNELHWDKMYEELITK